MRPVLYVAGPYTAKSIEQRNANIEAAMTAGRDLLAKGWAVIVPHGNTAAWELDERFHNDDFLQMDLVLLERCDALCAITGWQHSKGAMGEIAHAEANGLPVFIGVESVPPAEKFETDCTARLCERLRERRRLGVDHYGIALGPHSYDRLNSLAEALSEALDLCAYVQHELDCRK